ncbi:uncharacterized mitochondrial protein AtMg00810-like [Salvia splendens]|uniref:uncharacterized mitochondrial protein AtMg00810-like n=1 Tax=Salvia splendens TaxID=180675 RepID=UPI001C27949A|nr:uncharacterized mitochondrial protein AtMg00810-like [Salvia splendens]
MTITGDDTEKIKRLNGSLFHEFEMKDLGNLKYFLGIKMLRSEGGIFLRQKKYVLDILVETGLIDCKPVDTSILVNHGLQISDEAELADQGKYQCLVGKLIYLSHTRLDIAYAVGTVSQFMHRPQKDHYVAALRIVRYLKGTAEHGIMFKKNEHRGIYGFTDADWASNLVDRKSIARYFTFVEGNLVTWRSKKQKVVAISSVEV